MRTLFKNFFQKTKLFFMKIVSKIKLFFFFLFLFANTCLFAQNMQNSSWITKADSSILLMQMDLSRPQIVGANDFLPTIFVEPQKRYQVMEGFGYTLTGGSAELIGQLPPSVQDSLLQILFGDESQSIGVNYLRLSLGASDLSSHVFTYSKEKDMELKNFSLAEEERFLIPILKKILKIRPALKLMATPWTPPLYMKSNQNSIGGSLLPAFYDLYAQYFVKYIKSMQAHHIDIDAITIQNEPLHPLNNPSLLMLPHEQAAFASILGKTFKKEGIKTKILIYDHNADRPDYALEVLRNKAAFPFIDGTAFHLYGGEMEALSEVHDLFPTKNIYFTEQWTGAKGKFDGDLMWHVKNLLIKGSRNWCKTILEWNVANDPNFKPHTEGGCTECKGAVTIDGAGFQKNVGFYIIAHAAKFVTSGSHRIYSNQIASLPNVAFQRKDGKIVLIIENEQNKDIDFLVMIKDSKKKFRLPAKSVATMLF